jgi:hypothetical protein
MDPFTEQTVRQLQQSPAIDMTRGGVFENGQEGYRYSRWIRQV